MKKLILCLFATMLFGFYGNAQNNTFSKSAMVVLVSQAKTTYTKGMTYKDWVNVIGTPNSTIPVNEDKLLKDIYGFVSTGANPETIYKSYDGTSLLALAKEKKSITLGGSTARCGFLCQLVNAVLVALWEFLGGQLPIAFP